MQGELFLPCARGAAELLARECNAILGAGHPLRVDRAGVAMPADPIAAMRLNLHSRLAQRVLWPLAVGPYRDEHDLYDLACSVRWTEWITPEQTLRVDTSAHASPLRSINFATLRIKDAVCDVVRDAAGARPSVDTRAPHLALALHLSADRAALYVDTSGEPLFKRGWRRGGEGEAHGEAPLKETLAATMLAATSWSGAAPLLDPCCGAGTIAIEAAQIACGLAPGLARPFAFERLAPWRRHLETWRQLRREAERAVHAPSAAIHASDVSSTMVDIAQANAQRAGVAHAVRFTCADALERPPPAAALQASAPILLTNPPFGQRVDAAGVADGDNLAFAQGLASNWKKHYAGWIAWVLCPDPDFEKALRLKASARVPLWNGTIECRLLRFVLESGGYGRR